MDKSPKRRRRSSESGVTLIELMLACGVVAMTLALLMGSLLGMTSAGALQSDQARAAVVLAGTIETLRYMNYPNYLSYTPPAVTNGPGKSSAVTLNYYDSAGSAVAIPIAGAAPASLPNPLEVRAQIIWQDQRGHAYAQTLSAMLPR